MSLIDFRDKSQQNLTVAEWCYENGHYDACCNRTYYAMYHAAIAVLAQEGIIPSHDHIDHGWVQSQFVTHFCNRRKIFPKFRKFLPSAQENRNWADYRVECLQKKRAKRQLDRTREFVLALLRRIDEYNEF